MTRDDIEAFVLDHVRAGLTFREVARALADVGVSRSRQAVCNIVRRHGETASPRRCLEVDGFDNVFLVGLRAWLEGTPHGLQFMAHVRAHPRDYRAELAADASP